MGFIKKIVITIAALSFTFSITSPKEPQKDLHSKKSSQHEAVTKEKHHSRRW